MLFVSQPKYSSPKIPCDRCPLASCLLVLNATIKSLVPANKINADLLGCSFQAITLAGAILAELNAPASLFKQLWPSEGALSGDVDVPLRIDEDRHSHWPISFALTCLGM